MMSAPMYVQQMPPQGYAAPRYVNQPMQPAMPQAPAPAAPRWPPAEPQAPVLAQDAAPRAPVVRGRAEEEPAPRPAFIPAAREPIPEERPVVADSPPARLSLPSPEQLGVAGAGAPVDWGEVHRRLDRLGAVSFRQEKLLDGGYRVTFLLPTAQGNRTHCVTAESRQAAEAVGRALDQAEQWTGHK